MRRGYRSGKRKDTTRGGQAGPGANKTDRADALDKRMRAKGGEKMVVRDMPSAVCGSNDMDTDTPPCVPEPEDGCVCV